MSNNHKDQTKRPRNFNRLPFSFSVHEAEAVALRLSGVRRADDEPVLQRVYDRLSAQLKRNPLRADAAFERSVFESDLPAIAGESEAAQ